MNHRKNRSLQVILACFIAVLTGACSGSGDGRAQPLLAVPDSVTEKEASAFLMAASFGPTRSAIDELVASGYSDWVSAQLQLPVRSVLEIALTELPDENSLTEASIAREAWYDNAVHGDDQLRQRAAFALSQIFVVSSAVATIRRSGTGLAHYMDIMQEGAFGNFRDLLEEVTYNPLMGTYLTYIGNRKADPDTGSQPDENFARELMQLFTIGLIELNSNGTARLDNKGQEIETYSNEDVTELAKVFTGLWYAGVDFSNNGNTPENQARRMEMTEEQHSPFAKTFLGQTIPASQSGDTDISAALDILFEHPNTAPFICRQLIQRLTTSSPSSAYTARVVAAFEDGLFVLPNGEITGTGLRGDLAPVWAAILLDPEFVNAAYNADPTFGKIREPIVRFVHWARFANIDTVEVSSDFSLSRQRPVQDLGQSPYRAVSVFNFYRPGYVEAGSQTGRAGLTAPEMQITSGATLINYANFMDSYVLREPGLVNTAGAEDTHGPLGFTGGYDTEIALADDPEALVDHLNLVLTAGRMTEITRARVLDAITSIPLDNAGEAARDRSRLGVLATVNTPAFIVQQ